MGFDDHSFLKRFLENISEVERNFLKELRKYFNVHFKFYLGRSSLKKYFWMKIRIVNEMIYALLLNEFEAKNKGAVSIV